MALTGNGVSVKGSSVALGLLWVQQSKAFEVEASHLRLNLEGQGWRWVSRERSTVGVTFRVDHYARFEAAMTMVSTAEFAYDPTDHIATVWLVPTEPGQVDLKSIGELKADETSLWAEIVGGVASLIGQTPSQRVEKQLKEEGTQRGERKLAQGFSVALDLCTGRQTIHLGTLPQGKLPKSPVALQGHLRRDSGRVELFDDGLMMYGPFLARQPLIARINLQSEGAVSAELICEEQARRYYRAFLEEHPLPQLTPPQPTMDLRPRARRNQDER